MKNVLEVYANPFPELEELIEKLEDLAENTEPEEKAESNKGFIVETKEQAEWCLRQLARLKAEIDEIEGIAKAEIEKINAWKEQETNKLKNSCQFFERLLTDFHRRILENDPRAKTIKLPSGVLTARKTQPEVQKDEAVLLTWVEQNKPKYIKIKKSVNWQELKKQLIFQDSVVVDPETGEAVPGVKVIERGTDFRIKVGGGGK